MTNEEFRWWLTGFFELDEKPLTRQMVRIIENHLNLANEVSHGLDESNREIESILHAIRTALEGDQNANASPLQHQLKQRLFCYIGS